MARAHPVCDRSGPFGSRRRPHQPSQQDEAVCRRPGRELMRCYLPNLAQLDDRYKLCPRTLTSFYNPRYNDRLYYSSTNHENMLCFAIRLCLAICRDTTAEPIIPKIGLSRAMIHTHSHSPETARCAPIVALLRVRGNQAPRGATAQKRPGNAVTRGG